MIRVMIIDDKKIIDSVVKNAAENVRLAWAQENEKSPGYCVFTDEGELLSVVDNGGVFELLVRATLNHLDLKGIKIGFTLNEAMFEEVRKLGFQKENDRYSVDISEFFKPCCCK